MALRKVVYYPDPVLLRPTEPVTQFDEALRELVADMFETMYHEDGVGLAAPQIGLSLRLAVIDTQRPDSQKITIINPEIVAQRGNAKLLEGCLSVPGTYDKVERPEWIHVRAQDEWGKTFDIEGEGLLAEALSHEIEHLNGVLYIQHLSPYKRKRVTDKMEKFLKKRSR